MLQVTFVSACEKRALKRTRAVLDSYATRVGPSTWITPITAEGLEEVRALLRRSATRQTSVACYRSPGRGRSELLWTVGSRASFGADGRFAVNTTARAARGEAPLPAWTGHAHLLARAAGLAHDLGKFVAYFQKKLHTPDKPTADPIRHEWLSMLLLERLLEGKSWKEAWALIDQGRLGRVLAGVPDPAEVGVFAAPLASGWDALLYLVATHHKLPREGEGKGGRGNGWISSSNHVRAHEYRHAETKPVVDDLPEGLLRELRRLLMKIKMLPAQTPDYWRGVASISRMALILADHAVSAEDHAGEPEHAGALAYANTSRSTKGFNQSLVWHLSAVSEAAGRMVLNLARFSPYGLSSQAKTAACAESSGRFAWQERGAKTVRAARRAATGPLLVFNMAGTGAGKTRMNLRAAIEAAGEGPCRVITALNLRTLTLQTHDAYREQVGIPAAELACVIGDRTAEMFHEHSKRQQVDADTDGNEAEPEFEAIGAEADPLPEWLEHFLTSTPKLRSVIGLPCVVSTVDFLGAAGDPSRQGHHALAMLRLMTSDVILDEIDSYDPSGLLAVLRLVQATAFWGRNLIVSSATLSYPVARSVWEAFDSGLRLRESVWGHTREQARVVLMDDLVAPQVLEMKDSAAFIDAYHTHVEKMLAELFANPRRRPLLARLDPKAGIKGWHAAVQRSIEQLHELNAFIDPETGKQVSVGLVRVANIKGAIPLARFLAKNLKNARVACYHSQHFAVQRQHIEQRLDWLLSRKGDDPNGRILRDREIRAMLADPELKELKLVVVATPVEEIGRDHDFDYAVIEPSSAQSIVQVCGRVLRHRYHAVNRPNVAILQFNRKAVMRASGEGGNDTSPVFSRPGLESIDTPYRTTDLAELLTWEGLDRIDAGLRFGAHRLAQLDDQSLERALAQGLPRFTGDDPSKAHLWMSQNTYRDWPLREQSMPTEDWAYEPEAEEYCRWAKFGKSGKWRELSGSCAGETPRAGQDWLALDVDQMRALANDIGLTWDKAFAFKVSGEDRSFVVDRSFGVSPAPSRR